MDEVDEIIDVITAKGMQVTATVKTHNHADHVAGLEELAERTGANVSVHGSAGVSYPHRAVRDGDEIRASEVTLHVVPTPGHRPEHIALEVADMSHSEKPWLVLTGDSFSIGDVARPDLAVDGTEGAQDLCTSLFGTLLKLLDGVEVYPGPEALVLDVRSPGEYGSGRIPGALNVDLHGPQFGTRFGFVVPSS
ncbi:MAG: hypothetical protein NVS2B16_17190 [Chloroflexota bacterium]